MKKLIVLGLSAVILMAGSSASAVTIAELQAQIAALTAQLNALISASGGTTGTVSTGACAGITSFARNLTIGSTGSDVKCLQSILNQSADTQVAASGVGSAGNETLYFGSLTQAAVSKFQVKYGISPTAGYFGPITRAKANTMLGGGITPPTPTPVGGGLSVYLAPDTPASATVADAANANFTKFTMTAGAEGDVSITKMYITRSGLSANADVENIKIVEADTGAPKGSVASLNTDNKALITFVPSLTITRGTSKSFYIRAGIVDGTTAGKTVILGVAAGSDITSNASAVSGSFPANGNPMSVVSLTIGSVTVEEDGTTVDSQPDVGATGVILNQFKISTGSTEAVTIESITAIRAGSASSTDVANLELYDTTNGKSLGKVSSWGADDKVTWNNLNLVIDKGKTLRLKIKADIINGAGSSKTVNADIVDGSDTLITAKGNTYGFYITVSEGSWSGKGTNNQTIQNGSLNVSKSVSTPATGNTVAGTDIPLGVFAFDAKGEDVKITAMSVTITAGKWSNNDITRVALYDENGKIVAGPNDPTSALVASFTDTVIIPTGIHNYTVKAKIADSADAGDTVQIAITDPSAMTATGMLSNSSIAPTPASNVSANQLTIAGASLTATTLGTPAGRAIPKGTNNFVFATFSFDAAAAGEDLQITSITTTDSIGGSAAVTDIDNAALWADLTSGTSERGDIYETKISPTYQPSATTQAFILSTTLTIPKGSFKKVALVADLNSSAGTGNHTFYIASSGVTSNGANTGSTTTVSYTSTSKQTMTTTTGGTLTVTRDASSPVSNIILGNKLGVPLTVFKLAANNVEDLDLDQMTIYASNGNFVDTFYFYDGTTLLGSVPGGTSATLVVSDGTLTIPTNSSKKVTVKADMLPVDGTIVTDSSTVNASAYGTTNVQCTGKLSGADANSSGSALGYDMTLFKSRPYVAKDASTPSTTALIPTSSTKVAIFTITADVAEDITFENADSDTIRLEFAAHINDTTQTNLSFSLKNETDNQTLATAQSAASLFSKNTTSSVTFSFNSNDLTIGKGETKTLAVYLDTSDFDLDNTGESNSIQMYFDDSQANAVKFGINGTGAYAQGANIVKGDIYFGTLSNQN